MPILVKELYKSLVEPDAKADTHRHFTLWIHYKKGMLVISTLDRSQIISVHLRHIKLVHVKGNVHTGCGGTQFKVWRGMPKGSPISKNACFMSWENIVKLHSCVKVQRSNKWSSRKLTLPC